MAPQEPRTTIAILGPNSVPEHVLAHLLEGEGYAVRLLKAPDSGALAALPEEGSVEKLLEGVDAVLLWPSPALPEGPREAFLDAMRNSLTLANMPVLKLSSSIETALQDELAVDVSLERQFKYLVRCIEAIVKAGVG